MLSYNNEMDGSQIKYLVSIASKLLNLCLFKQGRLFIVKSKCTVCFCLDVDSGLQSLLGVNIQMKQLLTFPHVYIAVSAETSPLTFGFTHTLTERRRLKLSEGAFQNWMLEASVSLVAFSSQGGHKAYTGDGRTETHTHPFYNIFMKEFSKVQTKCEIHTAKLL